MTLRNLQPLFSPDDAPGQGAGEFSDDMAVLNSPDEKAPEDAEEEEAEPIEEEPSKVSAEDIAGEEEEPEEEVEEEEEPEEEVVVGRPSIKQIKKEFPDVFKKFPVLKNSLFRDAEFSKSFTSPEEAAEASVKAENYDQLEASLVAGSPELLMQELHETIRARLRRWLRIGSHSSALLTKKPILQRRNRSLKNSSFSPSDTQKKSVIKTSQCRLVISQTLCLRMVGRYRTLRGRARKLPIQLRFSYRESGSSGPETRFKEADQEIYGRVTRTLDQVIRQGIDPTGNMTERMKASIVTDVINEMNGQLVKDPVHGRRMNALWKRAHQDSYSRQSKESIVNTYLSGVKPLLHSIRNRIRAEYLGQGKKRELQDERLSKIPQKKRPFEGSSKRVDVRRERATVLDPKKINYARTSDADILSGKVTLKGRG